MKKITFLVIPLLLLVGCSKIEVIIDEELKINDVGLYPPIIEVENLGREVHLEYKVTNYKNTDIIVTLSERKPDTINEGYIEYKKDSNIWIVIPERNFELKSGETYITEIIIGIPEGCEVENNLEMWVSAKAGEKNMGLVNQLVELNSKILIKKGGETK